MDCYRPEQWSDYYAGRVDLPDRLAMTEHLAVCPTCQERYLQVVESGLRVASPDLALRTYRRVQAVGGQRQEYGRVRLRPLLRIYAVAASLLLLLSSSGLMQQWLPQGAPTKQPADWPRLGSLQSRFSERELNNPFYSFVRGLPEIKVELPSWRDSDAQQK